MLEANQSMPSLAIVATGAEQAEATAGVADVEDGQAMPTLHAAATAIESSAAAVACS